MSLNQENLQTLAQRTARAGVVVKDAINLLATQNTAQQAAIASANGEIATLQGDVTSINATLQNIAQEIADLQSGVNQIVSNLVSEAGALESVDGDNDGTADAVQGQAQS